MIPYYVQCIFDISIIFYLVLSTKKKVFPQLSKQNPQLINRSPPEVCRTLALADFYFAESKLRAKK